MDHPVPTPLDAIIEPSDEALAELLRLRADEPEGDALGLRIEIVSAPGEDFRYELGFDTLDSVTLGDQVRTFDHELGQLKVIVKVRDIESLQGSVLDFTGMQGLLVRNPNKPPPPIVEGLVLDDELSDLVRAAIDGDVNPRLALHGGYVTFAGHDTAGTGYVVMGGGCHGCSLSTVTMLETVEEMLTADIPALEHVLDITDHSTGLNPYYR